MTTKNKEGRAPSGNSKPAKAEGINRVTTDTTSDKKDYSNEAYVYVISSRKAHRAILPKPELGKTERRVLNAATRLAKVFQASGTPLPLECVISGDEKRLYFGKQFQLEKDVSGTKFADDLANIVEEGAIGYVSVMLDRFSPYAHILYGRNDRPEYFAYVHVGFGGDKNGEQ